MNTNLSNFKKFLSVFPPDAASPSQILMRFVLIFCIVIFSAAGFAEEQAPLNPAFQKYLDDINDGKIMDLFSQEGYPLGEIPSPVDLSHVDQMQTPVETLDQLSAQYDLRTTGKLTAIKNQANCGSCWSFATYGSIESWLKPAETRDFSEQNMIDEHGFDFGPCDGGNTTMSTAYLARWNGPVNETDDPYDYAGVFPAQKHVQRVIRIPRTPYAYGEIKQAVMDYGALYTSIGWYDSAYNSSTHSFYYNGTNGTNHAVAIVGWDDAYSKSNFSTTPPEDGAFIVRNSWGSGWGEDGYFYLSYYDKWAGNNCWAFNSAESTANYSTSYQYDNLGWTGSLGNGSSTGWGANVFTASSSNPLKAVSFYATGTNMSYTIYVFRNVSYGDPDSGPLTSTQSGTVAHAGYHTISLSQSVPLSPGELFSVVVKFNTPGYTYPLPMERTISGFTSAATSDPGESYYSFDGVSWQELHSANSLWQNICVKAFAGNGASQMVISGNVKTSSGYGISGVSISFSNSGGTTITDGNGNYSKTVNTGWSGTATPTMAGYTFTPATKTYGGVTANQSEQNYTGTPVFPTISGSVKSITGTAISLANITFSNGGGTTATDGNGNYSISVPYGYSGVASPYKTWHTFSPISKSYSNVTVSKSGENYTAALSNPILSVTPNNQNVPAGVGTTTFSVTNAGNETMDWSASVTSGGAWLQITSGASGTNSGTITCAFSANTGALTRTATIRVTAIGATESPKDVTVTQPGSCSYSINPTSKSFPASGGSQSVTVTASSDMCGWTISENLEWITVSPPGIGNGSVTVTASQNTGAARSGTVTIAGQSFSVSQAGVSSDIVLIGPGWNLISLPVQPANTAIADVLSGISGKYASVWAFKNGSWQIYDPANPNFSDLTDMTPGWGYYLYMNQPATLPVSGTAPSPSVSLISGWNLVGYNASGARAVGDALVSISGYVISVWAYFNDTWLVYDPTNPDFSDLTTMTPGCGYWINTNGACTWNIYNPPPTPFATE